MTRDEEKKLLEYADKYFNKRGITKKSDSAIIKDRFECAQEEVDRFYSDYLTFVENSKIKERLFDGEYYGLSSIDKPWLKYYDLERFFLRSNPNKSIYDFMKGENIDHKEDTSIIYQGRKISYSEMFRIIDKMAKSFESLGIKKGDTVIVCMPTMPETVYAIYALNKIGAVCDIIDVISNATITKNYINESKAKYMITLDLCVEKVNSIIDETELEKVVVVGIEDSLPPLLKAGYKATKKKSTIPVDGRYIYWRDLKNNVGKDNFLSHSEVKGEDIAVVVHTGGTTGVPKAVEMSNYALNSYVAQHDTMMLDLKRGQSFLAFLPPFIISGMCAGIHLPLCLGIKTITIPDFDPKHFTNHLLKYKPNHAIGAPIYWNTMLSDKRLLNKDFSYFGNMISGGEKMSEEIEAKLNDFIEERGSKQRIQKAYGMTEVCSASTITQGSLNDIASVGISYPSATIGIFDPSTDEEKLYGEIGEVRVSGDTMMHGYRNNEEENSKIFWYDSKGQRWVKTGDLGFMNQDGQLFIVDRLKRMITTRGYNIYPSEIERVIDSHPAVKMCKVVGIPNELEGQLTVANIILVDDFDGDIELLKVELEELCSKNNIPNYSLPRAYKFREAFPIKSNTGKIDYKAMENEELEEKVLLMQKK